MRCKKQTTPVNGCNSRNRPSFSRVGQVLARGHNQIRSGRIATYPPVGLFTPRFSKQKPIGTLSP
eukprot:5664087-Pyramimonas_sp.AAC.1